ncbi:MAG: class I SAM-dependent methyltransferase [Jatrophihabitantaceae bacterium]
MITERCFDELRAEGEQAPVDGWDFSWFAGRATEQRPSWGYLPLISDRLARVASGLDVQTGGGEVLAKIATPPAHLAATESWPPNLEIARRNLAKFDAIVLEAPDDGELPFGDNQFELVVSRHPTTTVWSEIARVLEPGGSYLSQQVGPGSVRELTDAIMGPQPVSQSRSTERARVDAEAAGLAVIDLRTAALRMEFNDIAAVITFLRKVIWTVPGFTAAAYLPQLATLHEQIEATGPFIAHSQRFLIEAIKAG